MSPAQTQQQARDELIRAGLADEADEVARQRARRARDNLHAVLEAPPGDCPHSLGPRIPSVPIPGPFRTGGK